MNDSILTCFADLRRNYAAYPFESTMLEADRHKLTQRVIDVLEGREETWILYEARDIDLKARLALEETELADGRWLQNPAAVLLVRSDRKALICLHEQDHVLIRVAAEPDRIKAAVSEAKQIAALLAEQEPFAKDERIGWLTAKPQYAGTGVQAGFLLHLPMLAMMQQIRGLTQKVNGTKRFWLEAVAGDEKNPGALYLLSSRFTAYSRTEALIEAALQLTEELTQKEDNLRRKVLRYATRSIYLDQIYRAWGILLYARRLTQAEFLSYWSKVRLGARAGLLPVELPAVDALLRETSAGRLVQKTDGVLDEHAIHFIRADVVRSALQGGT